VSIFSTTMWTQIGQAQAGSREALEAILSKYRAPVFEYLKRHGLSEADADDIVQEVFLQVCREEFLVRADRDKGKFRTLLMRVTQHVLASDFRKKFSQKRGGRKRLHSLEQALEVPVPAPEESRFNEIWAKSIVQMGLERLRRDGSRLNLAYHDALVLRYFEHQSQREIATKLGCAEHDVENYLRYGKERLKRILRELTQEYCSSESEHVEELEFLQRYAP